MPGRWRSTAGGWAPSPFPTTSSTPSTRSTSSASTDSSLWTGLRGTSRSWCRSSSEQCPEEDRDLLRTNLSRLGEGSAALAAPVDMLHRQAGSQGSLASNAPGPGGIGDSAAGGGFEEPEALLAAPGALGGGRRSEGGQRKPRHRPERGPEARAPRRTTRPSSPHGRGRRTRPFCRSSSPTPRPARRATESSRVPREAPADRSRDADRRGLPGSRALAAGLVRAARASRRRTRRARRPAAARAPPSGGS